MSAPLPPATVVPSEGLVTTTHVVYALHTLGLVIGAFGTASVIGAFLFGWPSIIAVIINYVKRSEVRGTWLDSQTADFVSFDPHFTALPHPSRFLFSTLMRIKPGLLEPAKGDYMLDAAASYELSPDHLTLTMKLRPNHKWHNIAPVNGRQVEADDVVFSYERLIKQGSNRGNFAGSLGGPIDSLKATDKSTIVIKLNQVYAGILAAARRWRLGQLAAHAEGGRRRLRPAAHRHRLRTVGSG